jgi:hypothetical protein
VKGKKNRVDDAMHATRAAVEEGIVPGGGFSGRRRHLTIYRHHHYTEIGFVAGVEGDKIRLIANADVVVTLEEKKIRAARQVGMTFVRQPVRLAHSFPRRRRGVGIKSSEHSSSSL